jgi:hypothetical protein
VVLLEREDALGGQLRLWAAVPGREIFATTAPWYGTRLDELGVDVRLGVDASAELVLAESPDAVIVATGSRYAVDGEHGESLTAISGHDLDFVLAPEPILTGRVTPTGRVVVIDAEGLNTGAGVAELLATAGARVDYVTEARIAAPHTFAPDETETINRRLRALGVTLHTRAHVEGIEAGGVRLHDLDHGAGSTLDGVDAVVLVTMRRQEGALMRQLDGRVTQLFGVGDALSPRGVAEATFEGHRFARMIGEPDAPRTFTEAYYEPLAPGLAPRPASAMRAVVA